jgi:hypothetical protein
MNPLIACACLVQGVVASLHQQQHVDVSSQGLLRKAFSSSSGPMNATAALHEKSQAFHQHFPFEEMEAERKAKKNRMKDRREQAARHFANIKPDPRKLERVDPEDWEALEQQQQEQQQERKLGSWFSSSGSSSPYSTTVLADPSTDYDKWAQGYRMLGGFIDCDHGDDEDQHSNDNNQNNNNDQDEGGACARWMMWAAVSFVMLLLFDYYGMLNAVFARTWTHRTRKRLVFLFFI